MSVLVEKLFSLHDSLTSDGLPHAFGGAIALAYCTRDPRGTRDIDVNVFVDSSKAREAIGAMPPGVAVSDQNISDAERDGQVRLNWDDTPVDLFFNNLPFHEVVAGGVRWVPLEDREIPVLDCSSLVVFKAMFDRTKDWADIENVVEHEPAAAIAAAESIAGLIGEDDPLHQRLKGLLEATT